MVWGQDGVERRKRQNLVSEASYDSIELQTFFFFCGSQGLNPGPCIYYALSLQTELSSRGLELQKLTLDLVWCINDKFNTTSKQI